MSFQENYREMQERDRDMIPKVLLRGLLVFVLACFGLAIYASATDRPLEAMPPALEIVKERQIKIYAKMNGSARVTDISGALIAELSPEQGGFVAGIGRVLERERGKVGLDGSEPIRLVQYSNGRLALRDDFTTWRTELTGFGQTNEAAFHKLLNN